MNQEVTSALRAAYDRKAEERNQRDLSPWRERSRLDFLELLQHEGKETLLEIGAGPGHDSLFFQQNGLQVISSDLSPQMVRLCHEKGLEALEMDLRSLDFADSHFDAVYAANCLLHVPKQDLGQVLQEIKRVLAPGGLFFYGVYGGFAQDGVWEEDEYVPKRYFAFYPDDQIKQIARAYFTLRDFSTIKQPESEETGLHFQRLILQN